LRRRLGPVITKLATSGLRQRRGITKPTTDSEARAIVALAKHAEHPSTENRHLAQSDIHVSPAQLAHYLRGVQFPASKQDLKADAQKNQAPPEVLKSIDELPGTQYHTMPEVMKALGKIE
jgi:Protein of unknown function (DUF2795)